MLVSRKRYNEAMEYYQRTIKTNPVYEAVVFNKVGDLYGILGDDRNAEKYYLTALDVHKGNDEQNQEKAAAYLGLSRLASRKGDYKQAEELIKHAFESFPRYEYNHYYQALLHLDKKEYDKAEKALSYCHSPQTEESMDEYEIDYGKAQIASARGDQKTALVFLEKAVNSENDYAKADIMAKAEKDKYFKNLRKVPAYKKLKIRVGEIENKLPSMKLNKSLLNLWH
ncbi:MAG: Tetratricopeptide repeat protein [bacterium ADurb.Bin363]|nr:MAG: Tetratricopeptide repeat protein [bacterium ADurb.Bin363]